MAPISNLEKLIKENQFLMGIDSIIDGKIQNPTSQQNLLHNFQDYYHYTERLLDKGSEYFPDMDGEQIKSASYDYKDLILPRIIEYVKNDISGKNEVLEKLSSNETIMQELAMKYNENHKDLDVLNEYLQKSDIQSIRGFVQKLYNPSGDIVWKKFINLARSDQLMNIGKLELERMQSHVLDPFYDINGEGKPIYNATKAVKYLKETLKTDEAYLDMIKYLPVEKAPSK